MLPSPPWSPEFPTHNLTRRSSYLPPSPPSPPDEIELHFIMNALSQPMQAMPMYQVIEISHSVGNHAVQDWGKLSNDRYPCEAEI